MCMVGDKSRCGCASNPVFTDLCQRRTLCDHSCLRRITKIPLMMRPLFDIATLKDEIESGALILTPNNRLANKIRQAWGIWQQRQGRQCWPTPPVEAIEPWLNEQWLRCCDLGVMMAAAGTPATLETELVLWEKVIEQDRERPDLVLPGSFARQARKAYDIVQRWQIDDATLQLEAPMLWRWIESFRKEQQKYRLITAADRVNIIRQACVDGLLHHGPRIHLCGFDSLSPLYRELLQTTCEQLTEQPLPDNQPNARVWNSFNEQQELTAAVNWAIARHQSDPEARIGIIIPELPRLRSQLERLLHSRLLPGYNQPGEPRRAAPFNLSAGVPLRNTSLVNNALKLLELNRQQLPLAELCHIINSPFWGEDCPVIRAEVESRIRERAQLRLRCSDFRYQVSRSEQQNGQLGTRLEHMETLRREMPRTASYSQWLQLFREQLLALGWPGERALDSIEYQQLQHWQTMLEQYTHLDQLQRSVELPEALRQLQQLAGNTVFQAETPDAAIQVLGLLEGAGLHFDHLWVMGLDDRRWPQPISPNPLLPFFLQRELGTPRSDPAQELKLAQRQLANLLRAAPEVILSHSQYEGDQPLQPTALIANIPQFDDEMLSGDTASLTPAAILETVDCEYAPALDLRREVIGGGTGIFKNQATCPFNAYAIHRLGARQPPEPSLGLSSLERGNLVHDCLERLWHKLQNQQQLLALSDGELQQLVTDTARAALQHWQKERPELFGPAFANIEQQRLSNLLLQWLALEKTRPPFRVAALEQRLQADFAGLPLRMTIDRIDELPEGQRLILDYKTGSA
ncbi:MAG: hypothetical protein EP334_04115, partial [Gammaproteobacteria bacterium]